MEQVIEKEITLPNVSVKLATVQWATAEEFSPQFSGYYNICQRLSDNHSALRIGNLPAREAFAHVRAVGFLPPAWPVKLYPALERPFRVLNCIFDKDFFEETTQIEQEHWDDHPGALVSIKDRRLETMMQEIYGELVEPGFAHDLLIEAASTMLLVEMARYGRRLAKVSEKGGAGQGLAPWQMRRIHERLEAAQDTGYPGVAELAALCGISQSHLMRNFKVSTGWQIHKYVAEERLKAAKRMLAEDKTSAREISARLGFSSPAYFATAFRRMTGKTPTEYQRQSRALNVH